MWGGMNSGNRSSSSSTSTSRTQHLLVPGCTLTPTCLLTTQCPRSHCCCCHALVVVQRQRICTCSAARARLPVFWRRRNNVPHLPLSHKAARRCVALRGLVSCALPPSLCSRVGAQPTGDCSLQGKHCQQRCCRRRRCCCKRAVTSTPVGVPKVPCCVPQRRITASVPLLLW